MKRTYEVRITPAYAGKSPNPRKKIVSLQDHPRLCGEKYVRGAEHAAGTGSPPPMRGKANIGDDIGDDFRITPAYAGKRMPCKSVWNSIQDHPRLCGEKCRKKYTRLYDSGSPPPMRGKVLAAVVAHHSR